MNSRRFSLETLIIAAAVFAAVIIRFIGLGRVPLTDHEASLALQALDLAAHRPVLLDPQPGYLTLTAGLFYLFESSNFLARFWPAVAGSALVFAPFLYRRSLGNGAAAVLAIFLAIEPGLVTLSRQAGGVMIALSCTALALGFYLNRRAVPAGIFAGLALTGGPLLWPGVILIALSGWFAAVSFRRGADQDDQSTGGDPKFDWRMAGISGAIVFVAAGTLFFLVPSGISAAAGSLGTYLTGWSGTAQTSIGLMLAALIFYSLLGLVLAFIGAIRGLLQADPVDLVLAFAWLVGLVLAAVYPARQVEGLAWALLPMWALAARQWARMAEGAARDRMPAFAQAALAFILLGFAWLNVVTAFYPAQVAGQENDLLLRGAAVAAALVLLILTSLLMGIGWSWAAVRVGLAWGVGLFLVIFMLSAAVNSAGLPRSPDAELWQTQAVVTDADLLSQTVHDLALWNTGERTVLDISVVGLKSPALRWLLRDLRDITFVDTLPAQSQPAVVITPDQDSLGLGSAYRGQDFVWTRKPIWEGQIFDEWAGWFVSRRAPTETATVILWARTDLFPGESLSAPAAP